MFGDYLPISMEIAFFSTVFYSEGRGANLGKVESEASPEWTETIRGNGYFLFLIVQTCSIKG